MLVTIQLGRRVRIDIRADKDLLERVGVIERELESLQEDYRNLDAGMGEYARSEDLPDIELMEQYLAETLDLHERVSSIDYWKADRHHSHKPGEREAARRPGRP